MYACLVSGESPRDRRNSIPAHQPLTARLYRRSGHGPTHAFLPSVTIFRPHSCRQRAAKAAWRMDFGKARANRSPHPLRLGCFGLCPRFPEKFANIQRVSAAAGEPKPAAASPPIIRSLRLPAQKRRNFELVLVAVVMHRSLAAVLVETLRTRPLGVFGHRLRPRFGRTRHWPSGKALGGLRHGRTLSRRGRLILLAVAAAETH